MLRVLCCSVLLAAPLAAGTVVGGPILSSTTWTAAGSPYRVTSSVIVGGGAVLTIEPGVEVRFSAGRALSVGSTAFGSGSLVARGSATLPIRFTSDSGIADWSTIQFVDSAVDATFDMSGAYVSGSILESCIVELASNLSQGAIELHSASPYLRNTVVQDNSTRGLWADLANGGNVTPPLRMDGCSFRRNSVNGNGGGAFLRNGQNHVINGGEFADNTANRYGGLRVESAAGTTLVGVSFLRNIPGGLALQSSQSVRVEACTVRENNQGGSGIGLYASSCSSLEIVDSCFEDNQSSSASGGGAHLLNCGSFLVRDCLFTGNDVAGGSGAGSI